MSHLYSRLNPPPPHNQKPWAKKWFAPTVVGFLALLLGIAIGTSGQPESDDESCRAALDLSEQGPLR